MDHNYFLLVSQEELRYRDLYGLEELKEAQRGFYVNARLCESYLDYLRRREQEKMEEQDNDSVS